MAINAPSGSTGTWGGSYGGGAGNGGVFQLGTFTTFNVLESAFDNNCIESTSTYQRSST